MKIVNKKKFGCFLLLIFLLVFFLTGIIGGYFFVKHQISTPLNEELTEIDFLIPPKGRDNCLSTFYVYPLRYIPELAGIKRENFVEAINAEGCMFYQGYTKPLYLQPMYQKQHLYKHDYPFSAPINKECRKEYHAGICPTVEKLHFEQMMINEHIRLPHTESDIINIIDVFDKVSSPSNL